MSNASPTPERVVGQMFQALQTGDFESAGELWADDAVWHLTGSHPDAGDYPPASYFTLLRGWHERYPDYEVVDIAGPQPNGSQGVMLHLRSRGGPAPGEASGWMLYRVVAGKITEGWAIPTSGNGQYPF
jgi:hypothetical protein